MAATFLRRATACLRRAACGRVSLAVGATAVAGTSGAAWCAQQGAGSPLFIWGEVAMVSREEAQPPVHIDFFAKRGSTMVDVAFSEGYTVVIDDTGAAWAWPGDLGAVSFAGRAPRQLPVPAAVVACTATTDTLFFVTRRGRVLRVDDPKTWASSSESRAAAVRGVAGDLAGRSVVQASSGDHHAIFVDKEGRAFAWGSNSHGQLGLGDDQVGTEVDEPVLIPGTGPGALRAGSAACGARHSLLLSKDGHVYATGSDTLLQLGLRTGSVASLKSEPGLRGAFVPVPMAQLLRSSSSDSAEVSKPEAWLVASIAAGAEHSLVCLEHVPTGETLLVAFGYGRFGQLGEGQLRHMSSPREVRVVNHMMEWDEVTSSRRPVRVVAIAAGKEHSIAALSTGDIYAWGANTWGQLGTGSRSLAPTPRRILGDLRRPEDVHVYAVHIERLRCSRHSCAAVQVAGTRRGAAGRSA